MRHPGFPPARSGLIAAVGTLLLSAGTYPAKGAPSSAPPLEVTFPKPPPAGRYDSLGARSPFAPPTAPVQATTAPPPPPPPIWAEKYTLGSAMQLGPGFKVTLTPKNPTGGANASPAERVTIATGESNSEDISIGNVQWSDQAGQTRVTLIKGGVPGVFTFDTTALSPGVTSPNGARIGGTNLPNNPMLPANVIRPPNVPQPSFQPPPQFQPPASPPGGIVNPGNARAPIRSAPPGPSANVPRVIAPQPTLPTAPGRRPPVPGNNVPDDDDD